MLLNQNGDKKWQKFSISFQKIKPPLIVAEICFAKLQLFFNTKHLSSPFSHGEFDEWSNLIINYGNSYKVKHAKISVFLHIQNNIYSDN